MKRAKERFYIFNIKEGDRGNDTEAFIKSALDHEQIIKWAYVLHDKETYNQHDMNCRYPDDAVKADFDFREYMERIKVNRKLERWKDILKPAPFKIRRRPEK